MGFYLTTSPENAVPPNSRVSPKTHTPASPVKERGLRFYNSGVSRWMSRDPIGERGGLLLFGFVRNNPIGKVDPIGLEAKNKECKAECDLGKAGDCDFKGFWYSPISPEGRRRIDDARDLAGRRAPSLPPLCLKDVIQNVVTFPVTALEGAAQGGGVLIDRFEDWARNHWPWGMYIRYSAKHCETACPCECGRGELGENEERYFYCGEQLYREEFTTTDRQSCFRKWKSMCGGSFSFGGVYRDDYRE